MFFLLYVQEKLGIRLDHWTTHFLLNDFAFLRITHWTNHWTRLDHSVPGQSEADSGGEKRTVLTAVVECA